MFAAFLRRFVEDPPTTVDFLVPKQGTSLASLAAPRKQCRVITRVHVETRQDHGGLVPKSKREKEGRVRATEDTQGHGPPTQKRE